MTALDIHADCEDEIGRKDDEISLLRDEVLRLEKKLAATLSLTTTKPDALADVLAWIESEAGPLYDLWANGDLGRWDDDELSWEQSLERVRDAERWPTASGGCGAFDGADDFVRRYRTWKAALV